jgi:hypothetical protein
MLDYLISSCLGLSSITNVAVTFETECLFCQLFSEIVVCVWFIFLLAFFNKVKENDERVYQGFLLAQKWGKFNSWLNNFFAILFSRFLSRKEELFLAKIQLHQISAPLYFLNRIIYTEFCKYLTVLNWIVFRDVLNPFSNY